MVARLPARPRLALPFTVLTGPGRVRLVAGEEFRFTLTGEGLEGWLPDWLPSLDGRTPLAEALARLAPEHRDTATRLLERFQSERLLEEGEERAEGGGRRAEERADTRAASSSVFPPPSEVRLLRQDRLDFDELQRFNADCLAGPDPWMWLTTAPLGRGYVSPVCLPDAGPCLVCLIGHFRRLSPLPELYDELAAHARAGGAIHPTPFPAPGVVMLEQIAAWKRDLQARPDPPPAVFALHVLEVATLEVSSHRVLCDPECPACHGRR